MEAESIGVRNCTVERRCDVTCGDIDSTGAQL